MVVNILLLVRFVAAAYIMAAGLMKVVEPQAAPVEMLPAPIKRRWAIFVRCLAIVEILCGIAVVVGIGESVLLASALTMFGLGVTSYGLIAIYTTGKCGCGASPEKMGWKRFLVRNTIVFGGIVGSLLAVPHVRSTWEDTERLGVVWACCLMPAIVIAYGMASRSAWWLRYRNDIRLAFAPIRDGKDPHLAIREHKTRA